MLYSDRKKRQAVKNVIIVGAAAWHLILHVAEFWCDLVKHSANLTVNEWLSVNGTKGVLIPG